MSSPPERVELEEQVDVASRAVAELEALRKAAESSVLAGTSDDLARSRARNAALEHTIAALAAEQGSNAARAERLRAVRMAAGVISAVTVAGWTSGLVAAGMLASHDAGLGGVASVAW